MTSNRDWNLDMVSISVCCPSCGSHQIANRGKTKNGKQRYSCLQADCLMKTFILDYRYNDYVTQILDSTMNSGGISAVVRELGINPNTVMNEIKKRTLH
ncbi:transposase [Crenothrix polyspora]|uniref:Transposase n=1 Tax=Crenothrix polyspora TaxID=360316 RepID=A0A1R4HJ98_9GAMM|nr:IS1 family transposase [Crenothrix polyspora]SJM96283.1 transposase [Crenothrix polyspora]